MILTDKYGRIHDYLRISVTDKCNFRCFYCNPKSAKDCNTGKDSMLSYEELLRIISIFSDKLEFKKFRFTGGEPLVRKGIVDFFNDLNDLKKQFDFVVGLTTNGYLLSDNLEKIKSAGVDRINISLDTLNKKSFKEITKVDVFENVLEAIYKSIEIGYNNLKINVVIMKGTNDDELLDFVDFAIKNRVNVRFIEYMPFSDNGYDRSQLFGYNEMINIISKKYSLKQEKNGETVSKDYFVDDGKAKISFITSLSEHFCADCNRLRVTSDGQLKLCLFSTKKEDLDIRYLIRSGATEQEIADRIVDFISNKKEMHDTLENLINLKNNSMISIGG